MTKKKEILLTCPYCKATCSDKSNLKRFARRHLNDDAPCPRRRAFNKKLAEGVRCVEDPDILEAYMEPAVKVIGKKIEGDLLALYAKFAKDYPIA